MNYIKHTAISFLNKHHLNKGKITFNQLHKSAKQNDYIVKKYSTSYSLLIHFELYDRARKSSSVSTKDEYGNVCIFIDDSLSPNKQLFALAHKIGHILLNHKPDEKTKKLQEKEANLFAHYLLTPSNTQKIGIAVFCLSALILLCSAIILLLLPSNDDSQPVSAPQSSITSQASTQEPNSSVDTTDRLESKTSSPESKDETDSVTVYYTRYGEVYHLYRDCSYLNRSKEVYSDTIEHCNKDRLCSRCANR